MIFETNKRARDLHAHVSRFMVEHVFPNEAVAARQIAEGDRWQPVPIIEALKEKAKAQGLWNLFLPESEHGAGLGNLEYAPLCELMGRSAIGAEPFNCSAPDTGNMETLVRLRERGGQAGVARAAARRRDPIVVLHDGARRGIVRRDQHPLAHRARRGSLPAERAQVVVFRGRRPALQGLHLHGQDRPGGPAAPASSR